MNKLLVVPAGGCLIAFAILLATLKGAAVRMSPRSLDAEHIAGIGSEFNGRTAGPTDLVNDKEAHQILSALAGEYIRTWREWQNAPHQLYSRAAPRTIAPISADVELSPGPEQSRGFFLGVIVVNHEPRIQQVPCILDRTSRQTWLFVNHRWLSEEEWLKTAPSPDAASSVPGQ